MKTVIKGLTAGFTCTSTLLCGCTVHDTPPAPVTSTSALTSTMGTPASTQIRIIIPHHVFTSPDPDIEHVFKTISIYTESHGRDFGGTFIPGYDPTSIRVWVAAERSWLLPDFVTLREKLDPTGRIVIRAGVGASRDSLKSLKAKIVDEFEGESNGKIVDVDVDREYNAVRVSIRYQKGDPDLNRMPLAIELSEISPNLVFQSVGSDTSPN